MRRTLAILLATAILLVISMGWLLIRGLTHKAEPAVIFETGRLRVLLDHGVRHRSPGVRDFAYPYLEFDGQRLAALMDEDPFLGAKGNLITLPNDTAIWEGMEHHLFGEPPGTYRDYHWIYVVRPSELGSEAFMEFSRTFESHRVEIVDAIMRAPEHDGHQVLPDSRVRARIAAVAGCLRGGPRAYHSTTSNQMIRVRPNGRVGLITYDAESWSTGGLGKIDMVGGKRALTLSDPRRKPRDQGETFGEFLLVRDDQTDELFGGHRIGLGSFQFALPEEKFSDYCRIVNP